MTRLSRKDRYQDLRQTISDQNGEAKTSAPSAQKNEKTVRLAAPDVKSESRAKAAPVNSRAQSTNPVLEDLLGEVKQYNLSNGDLVSDDTQMQILHTINSDRNPEADKRNRHLEEMETAAPGSTTLNLYSSDLMDLAARSKSQKEEAAKKAAAQEDQEPVEREIEVDLSVLESASKKHSARDDFFAKPESEPEEETTEAFEEEYEEKPKSRRKRKPFFKSRRKSRDDEDEYVEIDEEEEVPGAFDDDALVEEDVIIAAPAKRSEFSYDDQDRLFDEDYDDLDAEDEVEEKRRTHRKKHPRKARAKKPELHMQDEEDESEEYSRPRASVYDQEDQPVSKGAAIFMIVCVILLVILIILTIFWMSKLGIF